MVTFSFPIPFLPFPWQPRNFSVAPLGIINVSDRESCIKPETSASEQARAAISHFHAAVGMQRADNPARQPAVTEAVMGWGNRSPSP